MSAGAVVEGYISFLVNESGVFVNESSVPAALERAVAAIAGVPVSSVTVEVGMERRLQEEETRLPQEGAASARTSDRRLDSDRDTVIVYYIIMPGNKPDTWSAAVALDAADTESVALAIATELESAGLDSVYAESVSVVSLGITEMPGGAPPGYYGTGEPEESEDVGALVASLVAMGVLVICASLSCTAYVIRGRERRKRKDICSDEAVFDVDGTDKVHAARNGESADGADNASDPPTPREDLAHGVYDLDELANSHIWRSAPASLPSGAPQGAPGAPTLQGSPRGGEWAFNPPTREESHMSAVSLEPTINAPNRHNFWSLEMEPVDKEPIDHAELVHPGPFDTESTSPHPSPRSQQLRL